jgi:hypothetical protein
MKEDTQRPRISSLILCLELLVYRKNNLASISENKTSYSSSFFKQSSGSISFPVQ